MLWFIAGFAVGWLVFKRPDFVSNAIASIKAKLFG